MHLSKTSSWSLRSGCPLFDRTTSARAFTFSPSTFLPLRLNSSRSLFAQPKCDLTMKSSTFVGKTEILRSTCDGRSKPHEDWR